MYLFMFLLEGEAQNWLTILVGGIGSIVAALGGWKGIIALHTKIAASYKQKGALAAAKDFGAALAGNREFLEALYSQLKAVVKAIDIKEAAVKELLAQLPKEQVDQLRANKSVLSATFDNLPPIDVAAIPFKDIVNKKLLTSNKVASDEILKSLVTSARADESSSKALDRVAGILGAVTGEGLNIGSRILTGGTVDAGDILGLISGVGSAALGAKPSK